MDNNGFQFESKELKWGMYEDYRSIELKNVRRVIEIIQNILITKYNYTLINSIGIDCSFGGIKPLINDEYVKLCKKYNIGFEKDLIGSNFAKNICEIQAKYYFTTKVDNKLFFAKITVNGLIPQGKFSDEVTLIQEYDTLVDFVVSKPIIINSGYFDDDAFFEIAMLRGNDFITYDYRLNSEYKDVMHIKGDIQTTGFDKVNFVCSKVDNKIYINNWRMYRDLKKIKKVELLDSNLHEADDFVENIDGYPFLITFEDNTKRLLLLEDFDSEKKKVTRYFNNLEYVSAFVEKGRGEGAYAVPGLTFMYDSSDEKGEYIVEEKNRELFFYKRRVSRNKPNK